MDRTFQWSFPDVQLHIVDAPPELGSTRVRLYHLSESATADLDGAGPESIFMIVVMDSGLVAPLRPGMTNCKEVALP
jgi:hypothetical protein